MKDFENIKSEWKNQVDKEIPINGALVIIERVKYLKQKQQITNGVLGSTVLILIVFFFYISAYTERLVALALLLMISTLLIRMSVEYFSIKKLKTIKESIDYSSFKDQMTTYYKNRIKTHYIVTPILIGLYVFGFIILLPFFKLELSSFFYSYIIVSGLAILIIGVFMIRKQIQKEVKTLKSLSS